MSCITNTAKVRPRRLCHFSKRPELKEANVMLTTLKLSRMREPRVNYLREAGKLKNLRAHIKVSSKKGRRSRWRRLRESRRPKRLLIRSKLA